MIRIIKISKTELQVPEPLYLDEVKEHLNIVDDDNNEKLEKLIPRCRLIIENFCNISIIAKRIQLIAEFNTSDWPLNIQNDELLPYGPVTAIEAVQSRENTIGSGMPDYSTLESGWRIEGDNFYTTSCKVLKLIYTVGMSEVPEDLKLGILSEIAYRYQHLGDEAVQKSTQISEEAKNIVQPYQVLWL